MLNAVLLLAEKLLNFQYMALSNLCGFLWLILLLVVLMKNTVIIKESHQILMSMLISWRKWRLWICCNILLIIFLPSCTDQSRYTSSRSVWNTIDNFQTFMHLIIKQKKIKYMYMHICIFNIYNTYCSATHSMCLGDELESSL